MSEPLTIIIDGVPRTVDELRRIIAEHAAMREVLNVVRSKDADFVAYKARMGAALDNCEGIGL